MLIPVLALLFGVDIRYAIGASLVSVIATSSGAAAAYVKEGYTNIRIGMLLEVATTVVPGTTTRPRPGTFTFVTWLTGVLKSVGLKWPSSC